MVCHETYKDTAGNWVTPADIIREQDGSYVLASDRSPITVGRSEKMSKSKKNVVDPNEIIDQYGADTARWFMLSDSPPERDLEWTEEGVEGAWRFTQRLWRAVTGNLDYLVSETAAEPKEFSKQAQDLRRMTHQSIDHVSKAIEGFQFNSAIAQIYKFCNAISSFDPEIDLSTGSHDENLSDSWALTEALNVIVRLSAPMMPHLAEEMWRMMEYPGLVTTADWPTLRPELMEDTSVTIAIQVQGKMRDKLEVAKGLDKQTLEDMALASAKVQNFIGDKTVRKVIVVPDRIVNIVVG